MTKNGKKKTTKKRSKGETNMDMYQWLNQQISERNKKAMPLLSYPSVQFLFVTVKELVSDSRIMAMGMRLIADRYKMPFATSYMDLSVEAEAFGATTIYKPDAVPTIMGKIVDIKDDKIVIETGEDQVRLEMQKWAVMTNHTAEKDKAKRAAEAKEAAQKAKEEKAREKEAKKAEKDIR